MGVCVWEGVRDGNVYVVCVNVCAWLGDRKEVEDAE